MARIWLVVLIIGTIYTSSASEHISSASESLDIESTNRILYINSQQVDCVGVIPQKCFLVRESPDDEWVFFYDEIIGFNWEAGYEYELLVKATSIKNPPLDRSSMIYELIEIVSISHIPTP